jgi:hypothetical protein
MKNSIKTISARTIFVAISLLISLSSWSDKSFADGDRGVYFFYPSPTGAGFVPVPTGSIPIKPNALRVIDVDTNSITLRWEDKSTNESGFGVGVERRRPGDP